MNRLIFLLTLSAIAAFAGCASDTPRVDAQLGKSVEQMVRVQTLYPAVAANPAPLAPETGDGQRLKNALDAQRKDVPRGQEQVSQSPVFEAGKQQ